MTRSLTLSRLGLETFLVCQRRFQLRYVEALAWPADPLPEQALQAVARGQAWHQLLERHFLGLPSEAEELDDEQVRHWVSLMNRIPVEPEAGTTRLPELSLTVPLRVAESGRHALTGRFDLLVLGEADGQVWGHIYDWKTSRPRPLAALRQDWQTRLYLALLAESQGALWPIDAGMAPLQADRLAITYWYTDEPEAPRTIRYSQAWHEENWRELNQLVGQIEREAAAGAWPLTDDWSHCRACAYQANCGRQAAGLGGASEVSDEMATAAEISLEPDLP